MFNTLDIQMPPEVWCFRYVFGVQIASQEVFGCLGIGNTLHRLNPGPPSTEATAMLVR